MRHWLTVIALMTTGSAARAVEPASATEFEDRVQPVLMEFCGGCHHPEDDTNHVEFLHAKTADDLSSGRETWHNVAAQLRNRTMPPADEPQLSEEDRFRIAVWIKNELRSTACVSGDYAGLVTTRRLNRKEYNNTIRDLIGLDLDFSHTFPIDGGGGEGFDNNGETLFLPPLLMERYLEAAQDILDRAIITPPLDKSIGKAEWLPPDESNDKDSRRLMPKEEMSAMVEVYQPGEYVIRVKAASEKSAHATLVLKVDGLAAHRFALDDHGLSSKDKSSKNKDSQSKKSKNKDRPLSTTITLRRGLHLLTLRCANDSKPVRVSRVRITQDVEQPTPEKRELHRRLFAEHQNDQDPRETARQIITTFIRKAFRRPVDKTEIDRFLSLYDRALKHEAPFEESVKLALKAVLVSPQFLFRIEDEPQSESLEPISDHELATRLSYFLWVTMPDDELSRLADEGRLQDDVVLTQQVTRLLKDPKSRAFSEEFTGQWLGTRDLGRRVAPVTNERREKDVYSVDLAADMRAEPIWLFDHILRNNRPLLELIDCDYTFLNKRLAQHYGLPKVTGDHFREVALEDRRRGGVLGLGGMHMITSLPERTSPVLRGAWVLETLLGTTVPSPPPDIPEIRPGKGKDQRSLREILQDHRDKPACAACHDLVDPIGFGLQNFDEFGRWRDEEKGKPVDATGTMASGETFDGPGELKRILLKQQDKFARHLTNKLLGFALGRSLVDEDECTIQQLTDHLKQNDFRSHAIIKAVVLSKPFRYRQGTTDATE